MPLVSRVVRSTHPPRWLVCATYCLIKTTITLLLGLFCLPHRLWHRDILVLHIANRPRQQDTPRR
jgi:hypothetical protein